MKKQINFIVFLFLLAGMFLSNVILAQSTSKSKSGGASSQSGSSGTSGSGGSGAQTGSGSTSLDEGFHYILKPGRYGKKYIFHYGGHDYRYLNTTQFSSKKDKNIYKRISITQADSGKLYFVFRRSNIKSSLDKSKITISQDCSESISMNKTESYNNKTYFKNIDYYYQLELKKGDSYKLLNDTTFLICHPNKNNKNPSTKTIDTIYESKKVVEGMDTIYKNENSSTTIDNIFESKKIEKIDTIYRITLSNISPKVPNNHPDTLKPLSINDSPDSIYIQINPRKRISEPTSFIKFHYRILSYGALTVPYKYRFAIAEKNSKAPNGIPPDASASLNIAMFVGYKFGATKFYYDVTKSHNGLSCMILAFLGPGTTTLNSQNTFKTADSAKFSGGGVNVGLVTGGVGFSVEANTFNFGVFCGYDWITNYRQDWMYSPKSYKLSWIGLGIGFNLGMLTNTALPPVQSQEH